jgi:hypothetical protein
MEGKTSKVRWIGFGAAGALAVAATVVTLTVTGQHHDPGMSLASGSAPGGAPSKAAVGSRQATTGRQHDASVNPATGNAASPRAAATKTVLYTGVWAPGSGAQSWRTSMSAASFSTWKTSYTKKGLRIQDLRVSSGGTYTAVWRPGKGTEKVRAGLTPSQFVAANKSYAKQGLRVTSLDTGHGITAVWHPGKQAQTISIGLNLTDFAKRLTAEANSSMRPVFVDHYAVTGGTHWVGIFVHATGPYQARTTTSPTVFHNDVVNYGNSGLRLVALGSTPYTGVWRPGTGGFQVWTGSLSTFEADTVKFYKQGLRLGRIGRWTS